MIQFARQGLTVQQLRLVSIMRLVGPFCVEYFQLYLHDESRALFNSKIKVQLFFCGLFLSFKRSIFRSFVFVLLCLITLTFKLVVIVSNLKNHINSLLDIVVDIFMFLFTFLRRICSLYLTSKLLQLAIKFIKKIDTQK